MGGVCVKGISSEERAEINREIGRNKFSRRLVSSSRKEEVVVLDADVVDGNDVSTARLIPKPQGYGGGGTTSSVSSDERRKKNRNTANVDVEVLPPLLKKASEYQRRSAVESGAAEVGSKLKIMQIPNGFEGESVNAGWPSWLASVAGEAIKGWVPRKADSFEKLNKIGQGTYSTVFKAHDLNTGKTVALKKVRFVNMDPESVRFMAREIFVLRRLNHINIIKLEGLITSKSSCSLYLVFEYMEHDLAGLAATPSIKLSESQVKCYMKQLFHGLDHCHSRGVLHRDIKGANLLINNNGILKIADFGLSTFFSPDNKQPMTSRVVTLWYRPPELLLGAKEYNVAVDLWSSGCILAELLAGRPIMPGRTEVEQLHKIFKLCGSPSEEYWQKAKLRHLTLFKPQQSYRRCINDTFKDFPPSALVLLDALLAIEPANRGTSTSALESEFFHTKPHACDPSSLPKYPPSKEFDAKLRVEESRRQRAAALKGHGSESMKRGPRDPKTVLDSNTKLEKIHAQQNLNNSNGKYNNTREDGSSVFTVHRNEAVQNGSSSRKMGREDEHGNISVRSLNNLSVSNGPEFKTQRSYVHCGVGGMPNFSGLLVSESSEKSQSRRDKRHSQWPEDSYRYNHLNGVEASEKHNLLKRPTLSQKKEEKGCTKESTSVSNTEKNRINFSGPLYPHAGNIEEVLKEHERQITEAVRKAKIGKGNNTRRNYG